MFLNQQNIHTYEIIPNSQNIIGIPEVEKMSQEKILK